MAGPRKLKARSRARMMAGLIEADITRCLHACPFLVYLLSTMHSGSTMRPEEIRSVVPVPMFCSNRIYICTPDSGPGFG